MVNGHRATAEERRVTMYTAAFGSMFEGSMCGAGSNVFAVWLFALSRCDRDGDVELCPKPVSLLIGCSEDDVRGAIEFLTNKDPDSRSSKEEGRRLVKTGHFLYRVVNREYYLGLMSYEKKKEADRVRQKEKYDAERAMRDDNLAKPRESSPILAHGDGDGDGNTIEDSSSKNPSSSSKDDKALLEHVLEFWKKEGLRPRLRSISKERRAALLARKREHGESNVMLVLNNRANSRFLCYEINHNKGAGFDWVFGPKNFVKVMDGNYDDVPGGPGKGGSSGQGKSEYDDVL